jgi:hypothetical protein
MKAEDARSTGISRKNLMPILTLAVGIVATLARRLSEQ